MTLRVRKAVFPVAGLGTRFLPVTKAMPKELLPIVDKPLIQYAVEEAIAAGIDTLIFVTGRNKRAIEDHFDNNVELEQVLRKNSKFTQAEYVKNFLPKGVECIFVRQPEQLGLGHAILCAERAVGAEPFAVLLADDFIIPEGKGTTNDLVRQFKVTGKTQLSVTKVDEKLTSEYGIVSLGKRPNHVTGLIEKPGPRNAPSNFACVGRYLLTPEIFSFIRRQSIGVNGELQLTDALNSQAKIGEVEMLPLKGKRFDSGSVEGYIKAIEFVARTKGILPSS